MNAAATPTVSELHWYAVYCKHRHDRTVAAHLARRGLPTYVADVHTRARWGSRQRSTRRNLLPGYVLVRAAMDLAAYIAILQTPGVVQIVGNPWPRLSWIPDEQMTSLQVLLRSREQFEEVVYWRLGDKVEVVVGPLAGMCGLFAGMANGKDRVIVSLDLLQRSVSVAVNAGELRRVWPLAAA